MNRHRYTLLLMSLICLAMAGSAFAQPDTLSMPIIGMKRGAIGQTIPINLSNSTPVRSVQLVIAYDRTVVTVDTVLATKRTSAFSVFAFSQRPGSGTPIDTIRVVMIDTEEPIDMIAAGQGAIASLVVRTGPAAATIPLSFIVQGENETTLFGTDNNPKPLVIVNGLLANGPPDVFSVTENTGGLTKVAGDTIRVTVTGTPSVATILGPRSVTGSFDIGGLTVRTPMIEAPTGSGTYIGTYLVQPGDGAANSQVIGRLRDIGGQEAALGSTTRVTIDAAPPVFIGVGPTVVSVSDSLAALAWRTNEPTTGVVQYGIGNFNSSQPDNSLRTDHSVALTRLLPSSSYQARVLALDAAGNLTTSQTVTFTTQATPDTIAPTFARLPIVVGRTDSTLAITWTASEPARAIISLGGVTDSTAIFRIQDQLTIRGLTPSTPYTGQVSLVDAAGNGPNKTLFDNNPASVSGTTLATPDTRPPIILIRPVVRGVTDILATILYTTDEPSISIIQYGLTPELGAQFIDSTLVVTHNVSLANLRSNTPYFFRVSATDASGNQTAFTAVDSFKTLLAPDTTPPTIIEGPTVPNVTNQTALLRWVTDKLATSTVRFKKHTDSTFVSLSDAELTLIHLVTLPGSFPALAANTEYDFEVSSTDASGNTSLTRAGRFRTRVAQDTFPPRFLTQPTVTAVDNSTFTVQWQTDQTSDSRGAVNTTKTLTTDTNVDATLTTTHSLTFTNLTPNTLYFFRVTAVDPAGNTASSAIDSIRTRAVPDIIPPHISGLETTRTDSSTALIRWQTNELADSRLIYGTSLTSLDHVFIDPNPVVEHLVTLTGLTGGTTYYYRVQSTDQSGNASDLSPNPDVAPRNFTTPAVRDVIPPTISNVFVRDITTTSATISWDTDEAANSIVRFGQGIGSLTSSAEDGTFTRSHTATLTNLTPSTFYYFEVSSTDLSNNTATFPGPGAPRLTLTTQAAVVDSLAPLITRGPTAGYTSDTQVVIEWDTDEISNSVVFFQQANALSDPFDRVARARRVSSHRVTIAGLNPGMAYVFVVSSTDAAGNEVRFPSAQIIPVVTKMGIRYRVTLNTTDPSPGALTRRLQVPGGFGRFTTNPQPDTQAPVLLSGPTITGRTASAVTVQWATDELSTSVIDFGTGSTLNQRKEVGDLVTTHTVTLNNLSFATSYSYKVSSTDPTGNGPTQSSLSIATTSVTADVTPPVITVAPTIASNSFVSQADGARAIVTWKTDEPANSVVKFGTSVSLGLTVSDATVTTTHNVVLTRLKPDSTYYLQVASTDQSNNGPTQSSLISFTTASTPDVTPPTITGISTALTTNKQITVTWTTDEAASSFLRAIKAGRTDTVSVGNTNFVTAQSLSITDTTFVRPGTNYTVIIGSLDVSRNETQSNLGAVTTQAAPDTTVPTAPGGVTGISGNTTVVLHWHPNTETDLAGYHIFQKLGSGGVGTPVQLASQVTDTLFNVSNLTNDLPYTFTVKAIDRAGNTSTGSTTIVTPTAANAPGAPSRVSPSIDQRVSKKPILVTTNAAKPLNRPTATLTYTFVVYSDSTLTNPVASVSGIPEGTAGNPTHWQVINAAFAESVAVLDNTRYWWRTRANDGFNDGDWSPVSTFIADYSKPTGVELASFTVSESRGVVTVAWQAIQISGIAGFNIYRSLNEHGPYERLNTGLLTSQRGQYTYIDRNIRTNVTYYYEVEVVNTAGATDRFGPVLIRVSPPSKYALGQNSPNPFNPMTAIRYELPRPGRVTLTIYNILGQEILTLVNGPQESGFHTITWNGRNRDNRPVASGIYLYRITVQGESGAQAFSSVRKMTLIK